MWRYNFVQALSAHAKNAKKMRKKECSGQVTILSLLLRGSKDFLQQSPDPESRLGCLCHARSQLALPLRWCRSALACRHGAAVNLLVRAPHLKLGRVLLFTRKHLLQHVVRRLDLRLLQRHARIGLETLQRS
eukprot:6180633-Pleurochrysis_carterae.AAC.2